MIQHTAFYAELPKTILYPATRFSKRGRSHFGRGFLIALSILYFWANTSQACWLYQVTLSGVPTFSGVAGGPVFTHNAHLLITQTPITPANQTTNGENPFDIGIFTVEASPFVGVAGALYFATNTSLSEFYLGSANQGSALDLAFVDWDPSNRELVVVLDGDNSGLPSARFGVNNIYNLTSGITAQIHNILTGGVNIQFSGDFLVIGGSILLGGSSGFGGPFVSSGYQASFSGVFLQNFLCQ